MNSLTKVGIAAGAVALLVWGYKASKKAIGDFTFEVVGWGKPTLSGTNLTVPLQIKYNNPTPLPINVDRIQGDIYLLKGGTFVKAAVVDQPVSLQPGVSLQWINPVLNLKNVFGGDALSTLVAMTDMWRTRKMTLRSDVGATYGAITIPKQSFTNVIDL